MDLRRNEKIKDVKSYEGLYAVTTLGRVWSYRSKKWLKPGLTGHGYMTVVLCYRGKSDDRKVHRLVAEAVARPVPWTQDKNHAAILS